MQPEPQRLRVDIGDPQRMPQPQLERMEQIMREGGLVLVPQRFTDAEIMLLHEQYPAAVIRRNEDLGAETLVCIRRHVALRNAWIEGGE